MAGSPDYLNMLGQIALDDPVPDASWDMLEGAWQTMIVNPHSPYLYNLSKIALNLLANEQGKTMEEIGSEAADLHIRKNAGYAGAANPDPWANFRLSQQVGVRPFDGVLVRLTDKWSRIVSLRSDPDNEKVGESILDTLRDLAAYCLIAICLSKENGYVVA